MSSTVPALPPLLNLLLSILLAGKKAECEDHGKQHEGQAAGEGRSCQGA